MKSFYVGIWIITFCQLQWIGNSLISERLNDDTDQVFFFEPNALTFGGDAAKKWCKNHQGMLAAVDSKRRLNALKRMTRKSPKSRKFFQIISSA